METKGTADFIRMAGSPLRFNFFLFYRLPAAFFSGVRLREITGEHATATVPFKWFSQNPFRSIYFACQAMAAELSTGILAMAHLHGRKPQVSMLVVRIEGEFFKKGTSVVRFTCHDGAAMKQAIEETVSTGQPVTFVARSTGLNAQGDRISEFAITWSFKARQA
jgi:hypothetical protein